MRTAPDWLAFLRGLVARGLSAAWLQSEEVNRDRLRFGGSLPPLYTK